MSYPRSSEALHFSHTHEPLKDRRTSTGPAANTVIAVRFDALFATKRFPNRRSVPPSIQRNLQPLGSVGAERRVQSVSCGARAIALFRNFKGSETAPRSKQARLAALQSAPLKHGSERVDPTPIG